MRRICLTLLAVVAASWALLVSAQQPQLNSERIEATFGSYGIDVVYSDDELRLSNLYSWHESGRVTRTFAIVSYPDRVRRRFRSEHRQILAGGSIGATFSAAGWEVVKTEHYYFTTDPAIEIAAGMHLASAAPLAAHAYRLSIRKGRREFDYATIIEIHHPDYLLRSDLADIYGEPTAEDQAAESAAILDAGFDVLARSGSRLDR